MTLADVTAFLTQPAGRKSIYPLLALIAVVAGGGGFAAGKFTGAASVEERIQVVTVTHEVKVQSRARDVVRYIERTTLPDGTKTEKVSERIATKAETTTATDASSSATTVRKTERAPDWRVGVLVGATWKEPALVISGPLVLGVQVERRMLGPFSLGVWGTTQGAAGASISGEF